MGTDFVVFGSLCHVLRIDIVKGINWFWNVHEKSNEVIFYFVNLLRKNPDRRKKAKR